jgi:hypothetical protein
LGQSAYGAIDFFGFRRRFNRRNQTRQKNVRQKNEEDQCLSSFFCLTFFCPGAEMMIKTDFRSYACPVFALGRQPLSIKLLTATANSTGSTGLAMCIWKPA